MDQQTNHMSSNVTTFAEFINSQPTHVKHLLGTLNANIVNLNYWNTVLAQFTSQDLICTHGIYVDDAAAVHITNTPIALGVKLRIAPDQDIIKEILTKKQVMAEVAAVLTTPHLVPESTPTVLPSSKVFIAVADNYTGSNNEAYIRKKTGLTTPEMGMISW
eukprot:15325945-Ditylum_brightwellii.AAC.2